MQTLKPSDPLTQGRGAASLQQEMLQSSGNWELRKALLSAVAEPEGQAGLCLARF